MKTQEKLNNNDTSFNTETQNKVEPMAPQDAEHQISFGTDECEWTCNFCYGEQTQ